MGVEAFMDEATLDFVNKLTEGKQKILDFHEKYKQEVEIEWENKKFKWFFPKRRRNKLWRKIIHRYERPLFELVEEVVELVLPKVQDTFFCEFVDVKNITEGKE